MTTTSEHLAAIASVCQLNTSRSYTWFGRPFAIPDHQNARTGLDQGYLKASLRDRIYQSAFSMGSPQPAPSSDDDLMGGSDRQFANTLSAASSSTGGWEGGWVVFDQEGDRFGIDSGSLKLWVGPHDISPTTPAAVGSTVSIRMPRGSFELSPGYYSAFSDEPASVLSLSQQIVRFYFAVTPRGAAPAIRQLTSVLNRAKRPFRLKLLSSPRNYTRVDSAVLYLGIEDVDDLIRPLLAAVEQFAPDLRDIVPMFTYPISRGVAFAEEPLGSQSFGQHRSSLVADGILAAGQNSQPAQRMRCITDAWHAAGFDLDTAHLNPGSQMSPYRRLVTTFTHRPSGGPPSSLPARVLATVEVHELQHSLSAPTTAPSEQHRPQAMSVASFIAERLTTDAVWHNDRCTWLSMIATTDPRGGPTLAHGTIGRDLYDGEAGVALFLAVTSVVVDDATMRDTARAAAHQALRWDSPEDLTHQPGLCIGHTGVGLAAAATALLTGDTNLATHAIDHLSATAATPLTGPDLLMGAAGTILGLLTTSELVDTPTLLPIAAELGEHLLSSAHKSSRGWSWPIPRGGRGPHLTGLSHGASGIAVALAELFGATGDDRFQVGAAQAIAYERSWFDAKRQNWPDLRDAANARHKPEHYLSQWCHGAPGIALARLRLHDLLPDSVVDDEARIGLRSTLHSTHEAFISGSLSDSLCHGMAGNLDILTEGRSHLSSSDQRKLEALQADFTDAVVSRHLVGHEPWRCGIPAPDVEVPGLFLGTAGIGYYFLRAAGHLAPSVLLPDPTKFSQGLHQLIGRAQRPASATSRSVSHA